MAVPNQTDRGVLFPSLSISFQFPLERTSRYHAYSTTSSPFFATQIMMTTCGPYYLILHKRCSNGSCTVNQAITLTYFIETPIISTKPSRLEFSSLNAFGTAQAYLRSPYPNLEIVSKRASSTSKGLSQASHGTVLKKSLAMQPLNSGPLDRVAIGELRVRRPFREF